MSCHVPKRLALKTELLASESAQQLADLPF